MKQLLIICSMILVPFLMSAKEFNIDKKIKDQHGCEWHLTGTIDVGWGGLNSYNITAVDCHGKKYIFKGTAMAPDGDNTDPNLNEGYNNDIQTLNGAEPTMEEIQFVYSAIVEIYHQTE